MLRAGSLVKQQDQFSDRCYGLYKEAKHAWYTSFHRL